MLSLDRFLGRTPESEERKADISLTSSMRCVESGYLLCLEHRPSRCPTLALGKGASVGLTTVIGALATSVNLGWNHGRFPYPSRWQFADIQGIGGSQGRLIPETAQPGHSYCLDHPWGRGNTMGSTMGRTKPSPIVWNSSGLSFASRFFSPFSVTGPDGESVGS